MYRNVPTTQLSHTVTSEHVAQGDTHTLQEVGSKVLSMYRVDGHALTHVCVLLSFLYSTLNDELNTHV